MVTVVMVKHRKGGIAQKHKVLVCFFCLYDFCLFHRYYINDTQADNPSLLSGIKIPNVEANNLTSIGIKAVKIGWAV